MGTMQVTVNWSSDVSRKFPELAICIGTISNVHVEKNNSKLDALKQNVYSEVTAKYNAETLKDDATVRAFRDFYWKLDIDPTKTRPSGEALLRRILRGNPLPNISTAVDAYNLASLKTVIPISGFDGDRITSPFTVRFARSDEFFAGVGMDKLLSLTEKMLVLADESRILCIYPYRDSDRTKISVQTQNVSLVGYGAPRIVEGLLKEAVETGLQYIREVSDGQIEFVEVFKP
jgi:DNA/RNA-binding domain of Phe-tRNA-synthetase-like protein